MVKIMIDGKVIGNVKSLAYTDINGIEVVMMPEQVYKHPLDAIFEKYDRIYNRNIRSMQRRIAYGERKMIQRHWDFAMMLHRENIIEFYAADRSIDKMMNIYHNTDPFYEHTTK